MEEWTSIQGFDRYEISNLSRIRVKDSGKIIKQYRRGRYNMVKLDYLWKWVPDLMCKTFGTTNWEESNAPNP